MKIDFKWFGGGNWMINVNKIKIICDPVLCPVNSIHDYRIFKSKRINSPYFSESDLENVDIWLFTHGHMDHCDLANLNPISNRSIVVSDLSASKLLEKIQPDKTRMLRWGEKTEIKIVDTVEIIIEAIPAIHGLNMIKGKLIGNGNGYWIDIIKSNEKYSIYTTGDTLPNRQTVKTLKKRSANLMIANVGNATVGNGLLSKFIGRITMNMSDLKRFRNHIESDVIIPIHWDAFEHYREKNSLKLCDYNGIKHVNPGDEIVLEI